MSQHKRTDFVNLLVKYKWLLVTLIFLYPIYFTVSHFFTKDEVATWTEDVKNKKNLITLPWGASSYRVDTSHLLAKSYKWGVSFHRQVHNINAELRHKFGLKNRLCIKNLNMCNEQVNKYWSPGPKPMNVSVIMATIHTGVKRNGKRFKPCSYINDGGENYKNFVFHQPVFEKKTGMPLKHVIFVCGQKWALAEKGLSKVEETVFDMLVKAGKGRVARHGLMQLFFHKPTSKGGGITQQPPTSNTMDKYSHLIFEKHILPGYAKLGLIGDKRKKTKLRKKK